MESLTYIIIGIIFILTGYFIIKTAGKFNSKNPLHIRKYGVSIIAMILGAYFVLNYLYELIIN